MSVRSRARSVSPGARRGRGVGAWGRGEAGRRVDSASLFTTENVFSDEVLGLSRATASAKAARFHSRGIRSLLMSLPQNKQLGVRQLAIARLDLKARIAAMMRRLGVEEAAPGEAVSGRDKVEAATTLEEEEEEEPTILRDLREQLGNNFAVLRRLIGKERAALVDAALEHPEFRKTMRLPVDDEEQVADDPYLARLWRRRLNPSRAGFFQASRYRYAKHSHPTRTGDSYLWDKADLASRDRELSYYQRQQLRYGRGRRGSTAIAGAWSEIFGEDAEATAKKALEAGVSSAHMLEEKARAREMARERDGGGGGGGGGGDGGRRGRSRGGSDRSRSPSPYHHSLHHPTSSSSSSSPHHPPHHSRAPSSSIFGPPSSSSSSSPVRDSAISSSAAAAMEEASDILRVISKAPTSSHTSPPSSSSSSSSSVREEEAKEGGGRAVERGRGVERGGGGGMGRHRPLSAAPALSSASSGSSSWSAGARGASSGAPIPSRAPISSAPISSHAGSVTSRSSGGLPRPASVAPVHSVAGAGGGGGGGGSGGGNRGRAARTPLDVFFGALGVPWRLVPAAKLNLADLVDLIAAYQEAYDRWEADLGRTPEAEEEVPEVISLIDKANADARDRLKRLIGAEAADMAVAAAMHPDHCAALGLEARTEAEGGPPLASAEDAATSEGARAWRRRVLAFLDRTAARGHVVARGKGSARARAIASDGSRNLWEHTLPRDREDEMSYYERQRARYGRGRRGSASYAGAWEELFGDEQALRAEKDATEAAHARELQDAVSAAKMGDIAKLVDVAAKPATQALGVFSPM